MHFGGSQSLAASIG